MTISIESFFGESVFIYTREQAIADGVLVDVTGTASEYGFRVPVAITSAVWMDCISWDNNTQAMYQDESGRLQDILWMAYLAAQKTKGNTSFFTVYRIRKGATEPTAIKLKSIVSGGDDGEPVLTIMFPEED